jgi:hypothetical protein
MGPTGYPEAAVTTYQSTLHNIPEEQRSDLCHSGRLKTLIACSNVYYHNASQKPLLQNTHKQ